MNGKQTQTHVHICINTQTHITQNTDRNKLMPSESKCPGKALKSNKIQRRE